MPGAPDPTSPDSKGPAPTRLASDELASDELASDQRASDQRASYQLEPLSLDARIDLWDGVVGQVRDYFRQEGLREVSTPVRVHCNAVEPFIEPLRWGEVQLQTSPELWMKQLLGQRSIYQIAHCFRQGEEGPAHREEFHLIEWYRIAGELNHLQRDVECIVDRASHSAALIIPQEARAPRVWQKLGWLDLFERHTGHRLRGTEPAVALAPILEGLRQAASLHAACEWSYPSEEVAQLAAWVELFSLWSDLHLDPWLLNLGQDVGVHLVDFPEPLAALSRSQNGVAMRFESYFAGVELANAYDELRDAAEQLRRFHRVNQLRAAMGQAALPISENFIEHLREGRLPESVGAAMGLERLVATVCHRAHLSEVELCEGYAVARPPG